MRTFDLEKIKAATSQYADEIEGFYPEEWIANNLNIALTNDNEDIALFENQANLNNIVCGHYFFWSRGAQALKAGKEFLREIFTTTYVETITGLTPSDHKGALWMNRKLGFKDYGELRTVTGPCRFVVLTKDQWQAQVGSWKDSIDE